MTDTPPYYWLKGEDGALEEDDAPPPDGVLAARRPMPVPQQPTKMKNGMLNGLDLSRNRDRQRHGCDDAMVGVDRSGMPGGGLSVPGLPMVPGLAPLAPLGPAGGGSNIQRSSSIGPGVPVKAMPGLLAPGPPGAPPGGQVTPGPPGAPGMPGMMGLGGTRPSFYGGPPTPEMLMQAQQQAMCQAQVMCQAQAGASMPWAVGMSPQPGPQHYAQSMRGLACTPMQVQRSDSLRTQPREQSRPRSQAPPSPQPRQREGMRQHTAREPPSPQQLQPEAMWTRRENTPQRQRGEMQPTGSVPRSNSFVANRPDLQASFASAGPPDASPQHHLSNSFRTAAPAQSPMYNPAPGPQGPPSAHSSFAASPARLVPPGTMQMSINSYSANPHLRSPANLSSRGHPASPAHHTRSSGHLAAGPPASPVHHARSSGHLANAPQPFIGTPSSSARYTEHNSGMLSAPVPGMGYPRSATPSSVRERGSQFLRPTEAKVLTATSSPVASNAHDPHFRRHVSSARRNLDVDLHPAQGMRVLAPTERSQVRQRSSDNRAQSPTPSSYSFGQSGHTTPAADQQHFLAPPATVARGRAQMGSGSRPSSSADLATDRNGPRILVTGATGLLGRQVVEALGTLCVRGLCKTRARPPLIACDLTAEGEAARQITDFRPHIVIHLAGERRSDVLRRSPAQARLLNVDASGGIAAACEYCGAWLIFVSADAVFDGTASPYTEKDSPNPLSEYGWHKLHAEKLVLAACPQAAVLRVPLLYGPVESLAECAVTSIYSELRSGKKKMNNWQRCYPTWTCDVARVIRTMVDVHTSGTELRGIFHWQSRQPCTQYDIAHVISSVYGLEQPTPEPRGPVTGSWTPLPEDARLDCSRLESLFASMGIRPPATSLHEGLQVCIAPFHGGDSTSVRRLASMPQSFAAKTMGESTARSGRAEPAREVSSFDNGRNAAAHSAMVETTEAMLRTVPNIAAPETVRNVPESFGTAVPSQGNKDSKENRVGNSSTGEEGHHANRAAALKNIFREELELAWRRYRDAANDGKSEDIPPRANIAFLNQQDHRRGVVA